MCACMFVMFVIFVMFLMFVVFVMFGMFGMFVVMSYLPMSAYRYTGRYPKPSWATTVRC